MDLVSLSATGVLIACVVYLVITFQVFGTGAVSIALQIAAVVLMIWARITFGMRSFHAAASPTSGGLVTTGPYRFVRHPIYAAILLFLWTGVAVHFGLMPILVAIVATAMLALRMVTEERLVTGMYPEYAEYARRTKRVIPYLV